MSSSKNIIRLAGIMRESIVDGPGIRFAVFCQGCPHACPGCHNPETHDPCGGNAVSIDRIMSEFLKDPLLTGMTFSGGEPMCQPEGFASLAKAVKAEGKDIVIYSGFTLEQLLKRGAGLISGPVYGNDGQIRQQLTESERSATRDLLRLADVLIDGPFIMAERDLTLQYRGSRNQRVIDMNATRKEKKIILYEG